MSAVEVKMDSGKVRDIQREELKDLFTNFDSDRRAEFIEKFTDIWDDCFDIHEGSSHHRVMIKSFLAGYDTLKTERDELKGVLNSTLNYLHWNTDNLCGDDLIGDGKLTKRFKKQVGLIEETLKEISKNE